jgi:hypothetical protein
MPESHSKGEQRHYRTASVTTDDRSPVTAASRCGGCGYLTTAAGHRVMCDE